MLNLEDEDSVIGACLDMRHRLLGEAASGEGLLSFEVQKMMASGVEVILGMKQDPTWGPLLMVGSGGIYAEILRDMVWVLPPISPEAVTDALGKLRIWPMLNGVRGHRPADIRALSQLISLFGDALVRDGAWISSMDLNPVIVGPDGSGAYVVDVAMFGDEKMVEYWSV